MMSAEDQDNKIGRHSLLCIAFVDLLKKSFDKVNLKILLKILGISGCPVTVIRIMEKLHTDVHEDSLFDGELGRLFDNNNGQIKGVRGTAAAPFSVKIYYHYYFQRFSEK